MWVTCALCAATVGVAQDRSRSVTTRGWFPSLGKKTPATTGDASASRFATSSKQSAQPRRGSSAPNSGGYSAGSGRLAGVASAPEFAPEEDDIAGYGAAASGETDPDQDIVPTSSVGRWQSPRQEIVNEDAFPWDEASHTEALQLPPQRQPASRRSGSSQAGRGETEPLIVRSTHEPLADRATRAEPRAGRKGLPKLGLHGRRRLQAVQHQQPQALPTQQFDSDPAADSSADSIPGPEAVESLPAPLYPEADETVPGHAPGNEMQSDQAGTGLDWAAPVGRGTLGSAPASQHQQDPEAPQDEYSPSDGSIAPEIEAAEPPFAGPGCPPRGCGPGATDAEWDQLENECPPQEGSPAPPGSYPPGSYPPRYPGSPPPRTGVPPYRGTPPYVPTPPVSGSNPPPYVPPTIPPYFNSAPPVNTPLPPPDTPLDPPVEEQYWFDDWSQPYCWGGRDITFQTGWMMLSRSAPTGGALIGNLSNPDQVLNASDLSQGWASGVDSSLIVGDFLGDMNSMEVRYFGVDGWTANRTVLSDGPTTVFSSPIETSDNPTKTTAALASELHSFEVNGRHSVPSHRFTWLAGFRMIEFDERFDATLAKQLCGCKYSGYQSYVRNRLYGFQTGAEMLMIGNERFCLGAFGKAGVYGNFSETQSTEFCYCADQSIQNAGGNGRSTSFLGEVGMTARVKIWRRLSAFGRYEFLWLGGVASSTEQIAVTDYDAGTGQSTSSQVWFQGGTTGLELSW